MRILFVAAVDFELDAARSAWIGALPVMPGPDPASHADFLCVGWGAEATRQALEQAFSGADRYDLVVEVGIAGGRPGGPAIGDVVQVTTERHGNRPGPLLRQPASFPVLDFLPVAAGNTVQQLDDRFRQVDYDVESMEGAAFFEACLRHGCAFAEIRAVSNVVGETDHARWDIPLALARLEAALKLMCNRLERPDQVRHDVADETQDSI